MPLRASVYRSSQYSKHSNLPRFCSNPSFTVVASDVKDTLAAAMTGVLLLSRCYSLFSLELIHLIGLTKSFDFLVTFLWSKLIS